MAQPATLVTIIASTDPDRRRGQRQRLQAAIAKLAYAIDIGAVTPLAAELDALAFLCDEYHLTAEAARVRRWMETTV
jgi:hypothetical protein